MDESSGTFPYRVAEGLPVIQAQSPRGSSNEQRKNSSLCASGRLRVAIPGTMTAYRIDPARCCESVRDESDNLEVLELLSSSIDSQNWSSQKVKGDPLSVRQAFNFAWPIFKKRFGLFTAVLATIFGAWVTLEIVVIAGQRFGILLWAVAHLAFLIFVGGMEVGFLRICLALSDGREPKFADTFAHLNLGLKFLTGQILYMLLIVIGLLLLVVPGVYLAVRYAVFGFCLAAGETNVARCFQQSAILSTGAKPYLLRILVVLLVFNVLGAGLLGLGLFITVPLSVLMLTAAYQQLSARRRVNSSAISSG